MRTDPTVVKDAVINRLLFEIGNGYVIRLRIGGVIIVCTKMEFRGGIALELSFDSFSVIDWENTLDRTFCWNTWRRSRFEIVVCALLLIGFPNDWFPTNVALQFFILLHQLFSHLSPLWTNPMWHATIRGCQLGLLLIGQYILIQTPISTADRFVYWNAIIVLILQLYGFFGLELCMLLFRFGQRLIRERRRMLLIKHGIERYICNRTDVQCVICLSVIDVFQDIGKLACHHRFHYACIVPWVINYQSRCPICRASVRRVATPSPITDSSEDANTPRMRDFSDDQ
jgi:hypothetical protein